MREKRNYRRTQRPKHNPKWNAKVEELRLKCPRCGGELSPPDKGLLFCENDDCELIDTKYNFHKRTFYSTRIDPSLEVRNIPSPLIA